MFQAINHGASGLGDSSGGSVNQEDSKTSRTMGLRKRYWLVVLTILINMKISWEGLFPYNMEKQKMFQTTNQYRKRSFFLHKNKTDVFF